MVDQYSGHIEDLKKKQAIAERDGSMLTETTEGYQVPGHVRDDRINEDHDL